MPYYAQKHSGPWAEHAIIDEAEFEAYPFKDKYLRNGGVVKMSDATARDMQHPEVDTARLADIDAQIGQLQAERAKLLGAVPDAHAPAAVAYDLDRDDQPTTQEADRSRAAGHEVIQPTAGDVVVGAVVPGEAAPDADDAADTPEEGREPAHTTRNTIPQESRRERK